MDGADSMPTVSLATAAQNMDVMASARLSVLCLGIGHSAFSTGTRHDC